MAEWILSPESENDFQILMIRALGRLFIFIIVRQCYTCIYLNGLQVFIITKYQLLYEGGVGVAMKKTKAAFGIVSEAALYYLWH